MTHYDMNDSETRRKVFWQLQRLTSYSLWERKRAAFELFTRAYENAVKTWPKSQPEQVEADSLGYLYETLSLYNKGLDELVKGRRHVWRIDQPLYEAWGRSALTRSDLYRHPDFWERGMQLEPWPPKIEALHQLLIASMFKGEASPLEVNPDSLAPIAYTSTPHLLLDPTWYKETFYSLPYPVFPDALPELPKPTEIVVATGDKVPEDGIWEPVRDRRKRVLAVIVIGAPQYENNGCFNYFVRGTIAPKISCESGFERTRWRLLWKDDRYVDGVIPDESEYFLTPKATKSELPDAVGAEVKTGEICPVSGLWTARDHDSAPIKVQAGSVMPDLLLKDHLGEPIVRWVVWKLVKAE